MIGKNAGQSILGGRHNTSIGVNSANGVTSGLYNICLGYQAGQNISSGDGNVMIGAALNADSATGDHQLKIVGHNDSATVTWINGDSSGNVTFTAEIDAVTLEISGKRWQLHIPGEKYESKYYPEFDISHVENFQKIR